MATGTTTTAATVRCVALADPPEEVLPLMGTVGVLAVDVVDVDRLHLLAERGMRSEPPPWSALVWTAPGTDPVGHRPLLDLDLVRHHGWGDVDRAGSGTVLMVSLVGRSQEVDHPTFVDRYRAHAEVAREHHGFAAYRQNVAAPGGAGPAAVSEILLASEADWRDRFYAHDDSAAVVGADVVGFLDRRATSSTLVRRFTGTRSGTRSEMLSGCDG